MRTRAACATLPTKAGVKYEVGCNNAHKKGEKLNEYIIIPEASDMLRVAVAVAFRRARLKYAYEILRGKDLSKHGSVADVPEVMATRREEQFRLFGAALDKVLDVQIWRDYLDCVERAGFLNRNMVRSSAASTYSYALYLIGRFDFGISHEKLKPVIARWFFMVLLKARYDSEGAMEIDLNNIGECNSASDFISYLNSVIATNLTNDFWTLTLPGSLAVSLAAPPVQSAFWAAQVLLNARGLFTNDLLALRLDPRRAGKRKPLERHHLFPKAYLEKMGFSRVMQNQVANMALLDWHINTRVRDAAPSVYFPTAKTAWEKELGGDAVHLAEEQRLNALPEGWEHMEYTDFLEKRRVLMAGIIREGFETL